MDDIQEAKKLIAQARKEHQKVIRQMELDKTVDFFDSRIREHARPRRPGPSTTWPRPRNARSTTTAATSSPTLTSSEARTS
jgi:hypothetical protein